MNQVRLDRYLKVSRLIKRRTVAKEVADKSRIEVNGKTVKPAYTLKVGDLITLHLGLKIILVEVTSLTPLKDDLMFKLISEEKRS